MLARLIPNAKGPKTFKRKLLAWISPIITTKFDTNLVLITQGPEHCQTCENYRKNDWN